ncbi:hypothetical protein JTB14_032798 [Gonioctena quinquepunctata]|nr:hypothetical protein JTB14_032798 [Gonioctena quinquepunctata]
MSSLSGMCITWFSLHSQRVILVYTNIDMFCYRVVRCISVYNRLKFGHGCYPAFLARIGITNSNLCEECNVEGDLDHIFFNCKNTELEGQELYSDLLLLETPTPINLFTLLALNEKKNHPLHLQIHTENRPKNLMQSKHETYQTRP